MDAAVAALIGAAIGAVGSLGGAWPAQRYQSRRDLLKLATEMASADYDETIARLRASGGGFMPPKSIFIAYYVDMLRALGEDTFDEAAIAAIEERQKALLAAMPRRFKQPDE